MYEDDYQFLYEYPINYSNINRRLRKIICNNEVCHAITETGLVFSWGHDIYHKGTLGLGNNIYQVNTPVLNKYLSKHLIFDISLSEEHCAAIDFNNCMYTWGLGTNGELGYYDEEEKIVFVPNKVICNNKPFLVEKIKCGKHYTAGITNDGIPFLFGNNNNNNNENNIIFFTLEKNFEFNNTIAKEVYCGDNYIIILLEKEKLLIYNFNEGLFEIMLNKDNDKNIIISKVNVIDKNFYVLDERNKKLYEFVYQSRNYSKPLNIKDFYLTEYEINKDVKLSIIEMPFFVKFLFFWIECSENQKKNFISEKSKIFQKISDKDINCFKFKNSKGPYINENFLFGNKNKIELKKVEYKNIYKNRRINIFSKGDLIKNHNKNNDFKFFDDKNEIIIDSNEEYLNLPISKNYGNKNDIKDKKNNFIDFENINMKNEYKTINNEKDFNKISNKRNSKRFISLEGTRRKNSVSIDRNRTLRAINEYPNEDNNETVYSKCTNNKNIMKKSNSFLIQNKEFFNNTLENSNKSNKYMNIAPKRNKKRSSSQIKNEEINSKTINKEEENEFDNILRNINNRKLMINHQINLEDQVPNTKKILSKLGRTKSKTEMLIKELHETFFGKENKRNNLYNYYRNNYIRNTSINKEETKEENKNENKDKKIFELSKNQNEIKIIENNLDEEKVQNQINNLNYAKKKEIEIDINKVLGIEKNKFKKINKKESINENEKTMDKNEKTMDEKEKLQLKLEKEKLVKEIEEMKNKKEEEELIFKEKLEKETELEKDLIEKELREKLEIEYKEKYEKEIKENLEQRKNFVITSEINKFIKGNENMNENKINSNKINGYKFIPERLKTENENEFVMKGIDKKNYNLTISNKQEINIENHLNQNNIKEKKNINNNNDELNLNIEDITSTRDIIFENNNIFNNNISQKIDSLISPISPQTLNESKLLSKNGTNRDSQQSVTISNFLQNNNINQNKKEEINREEKDENSLKFLIEENNDKKSVINNMIIHKEKEESFENSNLSEKNQEKEYYNLKEQESRENEPEIILELDSAKKKLNMNRKEKSKGKNHIKEIIEEKQELESLEDTNKSKNKTKAKYIINEDNKKEDKSLIQIAEVSNSNMKHISTFDQNIISTIRKFEPKELEDITSSLRFFSNRSENIISSFGNKNNNMLTSERNNILNFNISNNNSNLKPYNGLDGKAKNIQDLNNLNFSKNINENIKDQKMKIDDLEQSKLLTEMSDNNKKDELQNQIKNKLFKLKSRDELNSVLYEINKEDKNSLDDSLYFLLEDDSPLVNKNLTNKNEIHLIKVKNNKITELNLGNNLVLNNNKTNNNKNQIFNNKLKFLRNYNLRNKESFQNYHTVSEKQGLIEKNISLDKNESKNLMKTNIIRGIKLKKNKNKSYGKQNSKKLKKKIGIIEQIKKEQYEKKQQIIYNTFNNRNKIILTNNNVSPYINLKPQNYSKNSIANIGYNNMFHYEPGLIPININMNMNIMHDENHIKTNNENNNFNKSKEEISNIKLNHTIQKDKESFIILRKKYLDFLIKVYGNDNIPNNKEKEKMDDKFLKGLINNEIPIENINLNLMKCSSDMKNFIGESLENFKLQQIKEKIPKINDNNLLYLNTNNNEKMQLDYDEDIKDKSNILEPIELDKSNNYNLYFRKSFVESLSGIKNENKFLKSENNK